MVCPCCAACRCDNPDRVFEDVCVNCNGILSAVDGLQVTVEWNLPPKTDYVEPTKEVWKAKFGANYCCGTLGCPDSQPAVPFWTAHSNAASTAINGTYVYDISLAPCGSSESEPESTVFPAWDVIGVPQATCSNSGLPARVATVFDSCQGYYLLTVWGKGYVRAVVRNHNPQNVNQLLPVLNAAVLSSSPLTNATAGTLQLPSLDDASYVVTKNYSADAPSLCEYDHGDYVYYTTYTRQPAGATNCDLTQFHLATLSLSLQ